MNSQRWLIIAPGSIGDTLSFLPILNVIKEHLPKNYLCDIASAFPLQALFEAADGISKSYNIDNEPSEKSEYEWIFDFAGTEKSEKFYSKLSCSHLARKHFDADFPEISIDNGTRVPVEIFREDLDGRCANPYLPAFMVEAPLAGLVFGEDFWSYLNREIKFPILNLRPQKHALNSAHVFLIPGGSSHLKKWPFENYLELYKKIINLGLRAEFILGEQEAECLPILRQAEITFHFNENLANIAYRLQKAKLVIANDCGLMHLATVLGIPTFSIFGPTNRKCWFYYEHFNPSIFKSFQTGNADERNPWGILSGLSKWENWPEFETVWHNVEKFLLNSK